MLKLIKILLKREIKKSYFILFLIIITLSSLIVCSISYKNYKFSEKETIVVDSKLSEEEYYAQHPNGSYNRYLSNYKLYINESINEVKLNYLFNDNELFSFENIYKVQVFLSIISIIIGSIIILNEYKNGTIKMFLNKGLSRFKIFMSFLICCLILLVILNLFLFFVYTLSLIMVSNSFELFKFKIPSISSDQIVYINYYLRCFIKFLINMLPVVFIGLFSFCLSVICLNRLVAISVSFFLDVFGIVIFQWLLEYNIRFLMYTFLPYLDYTIFNDKLNIILFNMKYNTNLSLCNGNFILIFAFVIMYTLSLMLFIKRDIN